VPPTFTAPISALSLSDEGRQNGLSRRPLSGFRALVADILWIIAHTLWEHTEWGAMKVDFDAVTSLPTALQSCSGGSLVAHGFSMPASRPMRTRSSRVSPARESPARILETRATIDISFAASPIIRTPRGSTINSASSNREKFKDHLQIRGNLCAVRQDPRRARLRSSIPVLRARPVAPATTARLTRDFSSCTSKATQERLRPC